MKTALEAPNLGDNLVNDRIHAFDNKSERRRASDANRGIVAVPAVVINIFSMEEALKLYGMGYISMEKLLEIEILLQERKSYTENEVVKRSEPVSKIVGGAIHEAIYEFFGFPLPALQKRDRKKDVTFARHFSIWLQWKFTNLSTSAIAHIYYGNDEHTNVIHACNRINNLISKEQQSREKTNILRFLDKYSFE